MNHLSTEYKTYMESEAWNQKRLERLRIDGYTCQDCGADNVPLDVHHLTYDRFEHEYMSDLLSVCRPCHNYRHGKQVEISGFCKTCHEFVNIAAKHVKVLGIWWHDRMGACGHFWSWKE